MQHTHEFIREQEQDYGFNPTPKARRAEANLKNQSWAVDFWRLLCVTNRELT